MPEEEITCIAAYRFISNGRSAAFCRAFFSRRGRRDLFFGANFGIFVDFMLGAICGAVSLATSGTTAFFPAPLSGAFVPLAKPPSVVPFFLSAILSFWSGGITGDPYMRVAPSRDSPVASGNPREREVFKLPV